MIIIRLKAWARTRMHNRFGHPDDWRCEVDGHCACTPGDGC